MATIPKNTWGIFTQDGASVFAVDSVIDLQYQNVSKVGNFPVEKGSFASYNKIKTPYRAKVRLSVGGSQDRIAAFIAAIDRVVADTNLYNIVTPEAVYINANVEKAAYSRSNEKGANLILADLEIIEIRQVEPQYAQVSLPASKVKKADSASKKDTGKKQTETPAPDFANLPSNINGALTALRQGMLGQVGGA